DLPDAVMMFLDRALVTDHETERIHLLALRQTDDPAGHAANQDWFDHTRARIASVPAEEVSGDDRPNTASAKMDPTDPAKRRNPNLVARHSQHDYLDLIDQVQEKITDGEAYEVCLTNMLEATADPHEDALAMYPRLREDNP